jgi:Tfp pilus assembly protein PilF
MVLTNLGNVCRAEGDSKATRKYHEQSLAMYRRVHGAEAVHADIARTLGNLGTVCGAEGDSKAARKYHEQSLAMYRRVHGAEAVHPHIARALTNLGNVCRDDGDSKAARKYYEQSLAMYRQVHGAETVHADTSMVLMNLGNVCRDEGDSKAARKYNEQSLAMYRQVHGAEAVHADIAMALMNLGCMHADSGDFKAAKRYFEEALLMFTKVLPANHPDTQKSRQFLALCEQLLQQAGSTQAANPPKQPLVVVLCGLTSKPEWNGQQGTVHGYDNETGRYQIRVGGAHGDEGNLRPANVQLPVGTEVVIQGLRKAPQWNGKCGSIASFTQSGRYVVKVREGPSAQKLQLKLENALAKAVAAV